jgi:hypothetical protein
MHAHASRFDPELWRPLSLLALALWNAPLARAQDDRNGRLDGADAITFKHVGDVALRLFAFKPADWRAEDRRPAIVFYFGGGWRNGRPSSRRRPGIWPDAAWWRCAPSTACTAATRRR